MKRFIITVLLLMISRLYDITTTYFYIPDLEGELNPLVSIFDFGWLGTLIFQFIGVSFLIYTSFIYHFREIKTISFSSDISLKQFVSIFHFNNPHSFNKLFYKLPTNKNSLIYSLGAIVPKGLIIFSFIVGTSTTMLLLSEEYQFYYKKLNLPYVLIFISLVIMIFLAINFYKQERVKHSKSLP